MKSLFLCLLLLFSLVACNSTKNSSSKNISLNTGSVKNKLGNVAGEWQLQMLFASDNNWAKAPTLQLNLNEKTFTGNSGCNNLSGKFIISDSYFAFDKNIITTKNVCADSYRVEKAFLDALIKINKYTITKNELELGQGDIVIMKFKRS
jgi:heat shock protein HslJ